MFTSRGRLVEWEGQGEFVFENKCGEFLTKRKIIHFEKLG